MRVSRRRCCYGARPHGDTNRIHSSQNSEAERGWCWVLTAEGPAARDSSRPQAVLVLDCDATQPFARLLTFLCRLLTRHLQVPSLCCTCTLSPSLHANLGPCTSRAAPPYPFTFGSHFSLSSQLKNENPEEPRTRIFPTHPCLVGVFVPVTSLASLGRLSVGL